MQKKVNYDTLFISKIASERENRDRAKETESRKGEYNMRVEIRLSEDIEEPYAVLYTKRLTEEIAQLAELLKHAPEGLHAAVQTATQSIRQAGVLTVSEEERMVVLRPEEIYLIRVEQEKTMVYGKTKKYTSGKRLYELEQYLGRGFMRISKSALVNLRYLDYVEASFHGIMLLRLKNQSEEYVSRKYLPDLKRYLGL